ncbi:hypothetical protein MIMGU_mgv11b020081mg [Erythranthe guttata]|uniref:Uncharacterized protein n=1 Tax=Erythranthe guttata TaxID=4155 RepID=A0A022QNC5_ERYGU|nr:hypothetical protein MIMGU_mgv11b020081mg [Erythranthe guttata]
MHANGLYPDKLAPSKLQTLITFDSGGVTTQSAYAREARSDAVVVSIGRSPIDPTLEIAPLKKTHANRLDSDILALSKLQTLITFDSGGVPTQSAHAHEARSDPVFAHIGRSPMDPTLELKIARLARSRAVSDATGTCIGEIRAFSIDLPPPNFSARSVRALDFARQMHGEWERNRRKNKKKENRETGKIPSSRQIGATRGLPRGSPILVLLSPKHA